MDANAVLALIHQGESETVEFKRGVPSVKDLAETVVCMANASGGYVLLGVADDGTVLGCGDCDTGELKRGVFLSTSPPLVVEIEEVRLDPGVVVVISVPESPVLHATTGGKYLVRVGAVCQPLPPHQVPRILVEKGQLDYTATVIPGGRCEELLDPLEVRRLRSLLRDRAPQSELSSLPDLDFLVALELARPDGETVRPTVAGVLVAGTQAALREVVPGSRVVYLHFGDNDIEYDYRADVHGPLVATLERLAELIEARNRLQSVEVGLLRHEVRDFPPEVYREGILNALTHRDYTQGDDIIIRHRHDRLEVESPGGFLHGITPANILHHRPKHRNPALARLFEKLGYVERAGVGVDRMYRALLAHGKEPPEFIDDGDSVRLIIRDGAFDRPFARFVAEQSARGRPLSLDHLIVLAHLRRNREIDRRTTAFACQRTEREAAEILSQMVREGLLESSGTRKGTVYRLPARLYKLAGHEAGYVRDKGLGRIRHREMVLEYVRTWGPITNEKCRELCGLSFPQASRLLREMCGEGYLRREGKTRGAQYVLAEATPR